MKKILPLSLLVLSLMFPNLSLGKVTFLKKGLAKRYLPLLCVLEFLENFLIIYLGILKRKEK
jgi:hypothetical protein|tara:strand:+ start:1185 stop:1370 length:186 start_codon:yes stop_codon:yes gene_type:complete